MKKMFTMFIAAVIVLMVAMPTFAASFADTDGKSCETAVEVLASLGIVEGKSEGTYEPDSTLTRAEMTTIILRLMNLADSAEGRSIFLDVPSSHWAYANIAAAHQLGIINGTSETTFAPDAVVTYEQAVKMMVAALGYSIQAEALGGYPAGYLSKAAQLDLLKGVEKGGEMTRGNMAVLAYNALDTELFLQYTFGDEAYDFETNETKNLLSYYLKVTKTTGAVTATPMAQIDAASHSRRLLSDEVAMGAQILKKGETDAQDMLGIRSDVYTKLPDDSEIPVILAIVPRATVEVTEVASGAIDGKTNTSEFVWEDENGTERKASIADATFIYNGREETKTSTLLAPAVGKVRLISDGGEYTMVIAEEYRSYLVDRVLTEDMQVRTKDGTLLPMDLADASLPTILTDNKGMALNIEDLAEWDVISVAESLPANASRVRRIYRSFEMISGKVMEMSQNPATAVISDGTYNVISPLAFGTISVGGTGAFYLDFLGNIVAVDESFESRSTYGWLAGAANTKGLNAKPQLKIFTQDGEMKVFDTAENITFNGAGVKSKDLLNSGAVYAEQWARDARPSLMDSTGTVVNQLLKYEVNDAGIITAIETAANTSDPTRADADKIDNNIFSMDWFYNDAKGASAGDAVEFNGTKNGNLAARIDSKVENVAGVFFGKVWTDANTKFFIIPPDRSRDQDYMLRPLKEFGLEENRVADWVSFYDVNDDYYCGAMVMHNYMGVGATISDSYPGIEVSPALILGTSTILGEDGEVKNTLKLYNHSGQEVSVTVEEDFRFLYNQANADINADKNWYTLSGDTKMYPQRTATLSARPDNMYLDIADIEPGDVVQYEVDAAGKLTRASVIFRHSYACQMEAFGHASAGNFYDWGPTAVNTYASGGKMLMNGKVVKTTAFGPVVEVHPAFNAFDNDADGNRMTAEGIVDTSRTWTRTLCSDGKWVVWDTEKETMRTITAADVVEGDELFTYWRNTSQWLTVVYR